MNYALLPREHWNRVEWIYGQYGSKAPVDDPFAQIAVALDADKIVGLMALQSVRHLEGLWTAPAHSGLVNYRALQARLKETIPGAEFFAFAPTHTVARICEFTHMKAEPWKVYRGRA